MSGVNDIWEKSKTKSGLKFFKIENPDDPNKIKEVEEQQQQNEFIEQITSKQRLDDKKLEFFTYGSAFDVGFEHVSSGNANKIYHGPCPVLIKFKETPERVRV